MIRSSIRAHAALQLVDGERTRLEELAQRRRARRPRASSSGRQLRGRGFACSWSRPPRSVDGRAGTRAAARGMVTAQQPGLEQHRARLQHHHRIGALHRLQRRLERVCGAVAGADAASSRDAAVSAEPSASGGGRGGTALLAAAVAVAGRAQDGGGGGREEAAVAERRACHRVEVRRAAEAASQPRLQVPTSAPASSASWIRYTPPPPLAALAARQARCRTRQPPPPPRRHAAEASTVSGRRRENSRAGEAALAVRRRRLGHR